MLLIEDDIDTKADEKSDNNYIPKISLGLFVYARVNNYFDNENDKNGDNINININIWC